MPEALRPIDQPPKQLHVISNNWEDLLMRPAVAIVGSRRPTGYGQRYTRQLAYELARAGVAIVSGLAYGVDSLAHQGALDAGGVTIAVLPASVSQIYPSGHRRLSEAIIEQGGALISEYDDDHGPPRTYDFVERNRLIAGLAQVVIVTEGTLKSGSRHTVDFANDQGKVIMAAPGEVFNPLAAGPNHHLQEGAYLVTSAQDVFDQLHIQGKPALMHGISDNPQEQLLINLLEQGITSGATLQSNSGLPTRIYQQTLTMLEISGRIRQLGNDHWALT
ncbi:MAG: hypothetical protein JWM37_641 [Candidatus Saccharibacteria bacterium]|nr:hypothetical protein [Candidatus Saccharibacteria bacterium]